MVTFSRFRVCGLGLSSVRSSPPNSGNHLELMVSSSPTSADTNQFKMYTPSEATPKRLDTLAWISMETSTTRTSTPSVSHLLYRHHRKALGRIQWLLLSEKSQWRFDPSQVAWLALSSVRRSTSSWKYSFPRPLLRTPSRVELLILPFQDVFASHVYRSREGSGIPEVQDKQIRPRVGAFNQESLISASINPYKIKG